MKNYVVRTSLRLIAIAGPKGSGKDTAGSVVCEDGHDTPHYVRVAFADSLKRLCNLLFPIPDSAAWGPSAERERTLGLSTLEVYRAHDRAVSQRVAEKFHHMLPIGLRELSEVKVALTRFIDNAIECHEGGEPLTARYLYQQFGTEFGRALYEHVWIDYVTHIASKLETGMFDYTPIHGLVSLKYPRARPVLGLVIPDCRFPSEAQRAKELGADVWWMEDGRRIDRSAPPEHSSEPRWDTFKDVNPRVIDNNGNLEELRAQVEEVLRRGEARYMVPVAHSEEHRVIIERCDLLPTGSGTASSSSASCSDAPNPPPA
jgi:hypothetical protein